MLMKHMIGVLLACSVLIAAGCEGKEDESGSSPASAPAPGAPPAKDRRTAEVSLKKRVVEERSAAITAAAGGTVELKNGFRLALPAGALKRDATVSVRRAIVSAEDAPVLQGFEYYRIEAPEAAGTLARPATLRVPLHKGVDPEGVVLMHYRDDGSAEALRHEAREPGFVEARVESFSLVAVLGSGAVGFATGAAIRANIIAPRLAVAEEVIANPDDIRIIRVPYYHQYDFSWCWATSAAMLFGAQGARVQPHEVAEMFNAVRTRGGCFWPRVSAAFGVDVFDFEVIRRKLALPDMPMSMYAIGGAWEKSLRGWLIQQLRAGYPVWVGLRNYDGKRNDHAVVVVGYDHVGFYVHDPSGALVAQLEVMRGKAKDQESAKVDEHKLACCRVPYGRWKQLLYPGLFQYRPWLTNIGVITKPVGTPRTVSMQIPTASKETALTFHRDGFSFWAFSEVLYYWNGQQTGGCGFSRRKDATDKEQAAQMGKGFLSNSDALSLLKVEAHNTGDRPFEGRIRLTLDGTRIAHQDPALARPVGVPPKRTRKSHLVLEVADRAKATDPGKASYTALAARENMSLRDALDFMTYPLHLGKHTLAVELTDAAGKPVDRCAVRFEMHPAVPRGVRAVVRSARVAGERQAAHEITWQASPEEKRTGGKGEYRVYRIGVGDVDMARPERVTAVGAGTYRAGVPAPKGERVRYSVSFVDSRSGYESPLAQPSGAVGDKVPSDQQYTYTWHVRHMARHQVSVQLQRKPVSTWPEPYVIAVEANGQVQYVYPANARGMSARNYTRYYHLPHGPLPQRLKLTAYFRDGSKKIGNMPIQYGRFKPRQTDSTSAYAQEARRNFQRALTWKRYTDAAGLVSCSRAVFAVADTRQEVRKLYAQATAKLKELYGRELAKRHEHYAKHQDYLETAAMAACYSWQDLETYMQMLNARHAAGTAHPDEYTRGVDLLVRVRNDTPAAHALFKKLKERIPAWLASLSEEDLKGSSKVRKDKISYTRLLKETLAYPVPPLPVQRGGAPLPR